VLTLVGLALFLGRWGYDDPYITYRYASNLLAGQGFVYNIGQRTLSTTAPLYALLLAGLGWLWPNLPTVSNALSATALVVGGLILFGWSRSHRQPAAGLVAALLLWLSPLLLITFGAETCFCMALILAGLYTYDQDRLLLAAALLALAAMVRPDGVLAAVAVVLHYGLSNIRPGSRGAKKGWPGLWRPVILYVGLVGAWYCGLWLYFGSPLPVTLLVKQQQGQMAISTRFGAGFLELLREHGQQPLYSVHGFLALLGLAAVARRARHWVPLLLWTLLYFAAYLLLGVSHYFWYYAPLVPAVVVLVAEGAVTLVRGLARGGRGLGLGGLQGQSRLPLLSLTGLLLLTLVAPLIQGLVWAGWRSDPRLGLYTEIGQWLAVHTPVDATVGALEVGIIGYHAQRPVVDFAGLVQPEVARGFTASSTYQDSATWAIQAYRPDYVLLHRDLFATVAESEWFGAAYQPTREFMNGWAEPGNPYGGLRLTLYRRSENR
jgi:hypothetical protein